MSADQTFSSWEDAVSWLRQQPEQRQLVADCYYDDPLIGAADRYWRSDEWDSVRQLLAGHSGKALDVGAGRGIASYAFAQEGFEVTALEPDPSALVGSGAIHSLSSESGLQIRVVEEFSERLPFASGEFDIVFARAALHHSRDLAAACREFYRVLRPGGLFIAIREHVISGSADLAEFRKNHPLHKLYGGENAFRLKQYMGAMRSTGFCIERVIRPFESVINYAPNTPESLRNEIQSRLLRLPLGGVAGQLLNFRIVLKSVLAILSRTDRRPGRLYSFVCRKPG
jgi:SAM-dependent methyltransferase